MPVSPARRAAFRILMKIEQGRGFAVDMLHDDPVRRFSEADRRLATELVYGVLRQKSCLDWYLGTLVERPLERLDREVRMVLRLGAYQILFLSRVPVRAAVHQSVELVKQSRHRYAASLINAVLRKADRDFFEYVCRKVPLDSSLVLSIIFSHPEWLVSRWVDRWGLRHTCVVLNHNNEPPRVHFRSNSPRLGQEEMVTTLKAEGYSVYPYHSGEGIWVVQKGDLTKSSLYRRGQLTIQGPGSQVIAGLLKLKPSDVCLDLCSGTGGKASHMIQLGEGQATVIGVDSSFRRLRIARELHGKQWPGLRWVVADGTRPLPLSVRFDKILVDAVCSGTGTLRRNPEIRWRLRAEDLTRLAGLQLKLLDNAADLLKPGGTLVYATCSLEPEENEQVVERFLASRPGFRLRLPYDEGLKPYQGLRPHCEGAFLCLPPLLTQSDGVFAAVMEATE
ncbi:MAG: 16S rRNA (cytosine(967)-C(5))-methyltransferase RsmB [Acidobacteriota bacterium]|nr:16S rRNA (cytosine(967)-C(5))-methyltransferase RsmB [Acidobacteriota bacterium]